MPISVLLLKTSPRSSQFLTSPSTSPPYLALFTSGPLQSSRPLPSDQTTPATAPHLSYQTTSATSAHHFRSDQLRSPSVLVTCCLGLKIL
uniref:Uncharacterized protein n=1 Tax=Cucumis sativus TaxID=3659 RepID=A0A0A0LAP6_CUCSA